MQKNIILSVFLALSFLSINTFSQDYVQDTLAVRAILDSNGLYDVSVEDVSDSSGGRIIHIVFTGKDITSLPAEIGNLTNLTSLWLSTNELTSLPAEIGNLANLIDLVLDYNSLTSLPAEIGSLTNLTTLWLTFNQLTSLPAEIGNLANLIEIQLGANQLTSLPDSIVKLTPSGCDFGYNKLDTNSLSDTVIYWLDIYDPDWRETQIVPIIYSPNSAINQNVLSLHIKNSSLQFNIPTSGNTKLQIYNMKGRLISTLVDSYKQAGKYTVNWDSNMHSSGIYYIKLSAGNNTLIRKTIIIK